MKRSILIVEDSEEQLNWYKDLVSDRFEYFLAQNATQAELIMEKERVDIILTDIHLSQNKMQETYEGFQVIEYAMTNHPEILVLCMSADPKISTYRQAMKMGANHWVKKPIVFLEELQIAIDSAMNARMLRKSDKGLGKQLESFEDGLILSSEIRKYVSGIAKSRSIPAIIYGETGTGKEEVAKLIHRKRCELEGNIPFMAVNCANLNSDMAPSILFGHRKGSFTGAERTTNGLIGEANGGILFLDEIHHLDSVCQTRLLRVLNDGSYQRLGDSKTLYSSFQVVVASSKDLDDAVMDHEFLMDLRSRLTGVDIYLPPLRDRLEDMDQLVSLFFARENLSVSKEQHESIVKRCKTYYWQGNIRQLFNVLKSFHTKCLLNEVPLDAELIPEYKTMFAPGCSPNQRSWLENFNWDRPLKESLEEVEKEILKSALQKYRSKKDVVDVLQMNRTTFATRLEKYDLN